MNLPITTLAIVALHILASLFFYIKLQIQFLNNHFSTSTLAAYAFEVPDEWKHIADSIEVVPFTVLLALLFSGVEKSVGSVQYMCQTIFTMALVIFIREFFSPMPSGATYLVYMPFFTFILNHKPLYYFKIKSFSFTDTLLYVLLFIQYILYDISPHLIDFAINLFALVIWKVIVFIFHLCFGHRRRHHHERRARNQDVPQNT